MEDKFSSFIFKFVPIFISICFVLVIAFWVVSFFAVFKISGEIDDQGGIAKTLGRFVADFECAKNNNCPTN